MSPDATVLVEYALHNFADPEPGNDEPLSEELVLPEPVTTGFGLAPAVSVVLENGRLTVLIRRKSRTGTAELAAMVGSPSGRVEIPLAPLGSWLRGAVDWPYADAPRLLVIRRAD